MLLFFVLIDFLEILISINLQLAAGSFVAGNNSVGMQLEGANSPSMVNAAFNAVAKGAGLAVAGDEQQHLLGVADSADTNGKSSLGHFVGVIIKETGVCDKGILSEGTDTGRRGR